MCKLTRYYCILFCIFSVINQLSYGQREFLVTVNPGTGDFTLVDSLDGVRWIWTGFSTFDQQNHQYIFIGADVNHVSYLYTVNAANGDILSSPLFPALDDQDDNIVELAFDGGLNKLFGLHWDNSEQQEYLVSINIDNGVYTKIDTIPNIQSIAIGSSMCDPVNHRYFFRGQTWDNVWHNYVINSETGAIVADPDYVGLMDESDNISYRCYDYVLGKVYALHWDNSAQTEYLVSVDLFTGVFETVSEIPGVHWIVSLPTYDSDNHVFIFRGAGESMQTEQLISVNTQSGQVISSPSFPNLPDPNDNIIELHYDDSTNQLFALHWDADYINYLNVIENSNAFNIMIYPNPFAENCTIKLNREYGKIATYLIDSKGKIVQKSSYSTTSELNLQSGNLPCGSYYLSIIADNTQLGTKMIVIE